MIESWFPTLIYYEDLLDKFGEPFNNEVYKKVKELQKTHDLKTYWKCDTFNTTGINLKNDELFKEFSEVIKNRVLIFSEEYKIHKKYALKMTDFWTNVAAPGDYQEYHNHIPDHFSAVFYVKTPENCGNIIFQSFSTWIHGLGLQITEDSVANHKSVSYKPRPSLLLIFPSSLIHMVEKNKSEEDRVSIAMNFQFVQ